MILIVLFCPAVKGATETASMMKNMADDVEEARKGTGLDRKLNGCTSRREQDTERW